MKNTWTAAVAALSLLIAGCSEEKEQSNEDARSVVPELSSASGFTSFNLPFPEGTQLRIENSTLSFTLPEPYFIVGIDENGQYHRSVSGGQGTITCECTQGTGCDPIKNGDDIGCLMKTNCSACKKSKTAISGVDAELREITIMHPELNLLITRFDQLEGRYLLPGIFLNYPEVTNLLVKIDSAQQTLPDSNKQLVFINVYGYILPVELKSNGDNVSVHVSPGSDVSCNCNVSGKCPKEKHWSGVVWCNSDQCSKCSMTMLVTNSQGVDKVLVTQGGLISLQ